MLHVIMPRVIIDVRQNKGSDCHAERITINEEVAGGVKIVPNLDHSIIFLLKNWYTVLYVCCVKSSFEVELILSGCFIYKKSCTRALLENLFEFGIIKWYG